MLIIEPSYDSYPSQIKLAGGVPVYVPLNFDANARTSADFHIDFDLLRSKITPKTKMLVLTSPNNPIGKLYTRSELEELARIVKDADLLVLADEVHEWYVFMVVFKLP